RNANTCPRDAKILPMSTKRKNLILKVHNRLRNKMIRNLSILLLFTCISCALSTDFCNRDLCKRQTGPQSFTYMKHIGCRHNG
uniref:CSON001129 protein n=1 Tax=Culicoides sonorensis TaxID=179676 RepID=A0A336MH72_CULSO